MGKRIASGMIECGIAATLIMSVFANVISFYLTGNTDDQARKMVSHGVIIILFLIVTLYLVYKLTVSDNETKRKIIFCMLPLAMNMMFCMIGGTKAVGRKDILNNLLSCGSYSFPLACGAIYMAAEGRFEGVIHKVKYIVLVMMLYWGMALKHFWNLKDVAGSQGFGGIIYLSLGYSAVVVYSFLIWDMRLHYYKKNMGRIYSGLVWGEMLVCGALIIMLGGRGPIVTWLAVNITAVTTHFIYKEGKVIRAIFFVIAGVFFIGMMLPSDNAGLSRQKVLLEDIESGQMQQSFTSDMSKEVVEILYNEACVDKGATGGILSEKVEAKMKETGNYEFFRSIVNRSMLRSYLWQLSVKEAREKPLTGMGPLGFQTKYWTYPHNVFLECLADFGVLGLIFFAGACGALAVFLILHSRKNAEYRCMIIVLSGGVCAAVISGNLYNFELLMFAIPLVIWKLGDDLKIKKVHHTV